MFTPHSTPLNILYPPLPRLSLKKVSNCRYCAEVRAETPKKVCAAISNCPPREAAVRTPPAPEATATAASVRLTPSLISDLIAALFFLSVYHCRKNAGTITTCLASILRPVLKLMSLSGMKAIISKGASCWLPAVMGTITRQEVVHTGMGGSPYGPLAPLSIEPYFWSVTLYLSGNLGVYE